MKILRIGICAIFILVLFFQVQPAAATTYYVAPNSVNVADEGTQGLGNYLIITGATSSTFTGNGQVDRAEFRLPSGFYFSSVALTDDSSSTDIADVVVYVEKGFAGSATSDVITITPIDYSSSKPGYFRGFELAVKKASSGEDPQIRVNFNSIYVPTGASGNVLLTLDSTGNSAFTDNTFKIAYVTGKKLTLTTEKTPSLTTGDNTVGPIVIEETMKASFDWIELTLPNGYTWVDNTVIISPSLGLSRDYDDDVGDERDYQYDIFNEDRYGQSVLRVALTGAASTVEGTLRMECDIDVDEDKAAPGNVAVTVEGNADPTSSSLTVGTFSLQEYTVTANTSKMLYGGLRSQEIANITITELVPGTLLEGRTITLSLPSWAKWDAPPTVQVEGVTELSTSTDNGKAPLVGKKDDQVKFTITQASNNDPGKIIIKDAKVNLQVDAPQGDLKLTVRGSAGISGDTTVGNITAPLVITALSQPALTVGVREQKAGDIEIRESAGRLLLADELWVEFPDSITLSETPQVEVTNGNLDISGAYLENESYYQRLVIPVNTASQSPGTISISNILYDVNNLAGDGVITIKVGGPAVNEVNKGDDPLFPSDEWAGSVVNAVIGQTSEIPPDTTPPGTTPPVTTPPVTTPPVTTPETRNILFFIDDGTYRVNGDVLMMDVAPYIDADRTFIPLRFTGTALGIPSENIFWDSEKQTALLIFKGTTLRVPLGENAIYKNETKVDIDVAPQLHNDRIMLPIRAIATAFGATVDWDAPNRMVKIVL